MRNGLLVSIDLHFLCFFGGFHNSLDTGWFLGLWVYLGCKPWKLLQCWSVICSKQYGHIKWSWTLQLSASCNVQGWHIWYRQHPFWVIFRHSRKAKGLTMRTIGWVMTPLSHRSLPPVLTSRNQWGKWWLMVPSSVIKRGWAIPELGGGL